MKAALNYGTCTQEVEFSEENLQDFLLPIHPCADVLPPEEQLLRDALAHPIGERPLRDAARGKKQIAVVISDISRPCPSARILPIVLDELAKAGVRDEDILIVTAVGSHRHHTAQEREKLVGSEVYRRFRVVDAGEEGFLYLGTTSAGTPVEVDARVARAEMRVCIGNIEYHYFVGYSGGVKALLPGVCSRETIQANHRHMTEEGAIVGNIDHNPVREDLEEAALFLPDNYILNVVLDEHKRILNVVAGDPVKAHRAGCRFLDEIYGKSIRQKADIVLVSAGGTPKDMNLYQSQKALDNARRAVRKDGILILVAECSEGFGEPTFEKWMMGMPDPEAQIKAIREEFKLGGHKAAALALALRECRVWLVSSFDPQTVERIHMRPFPSAQQALDQALRELGPQAKLTVIPYGGSTLPQLKKA